MLPHDLHDRVVGLLARPVALPFEQHLLPGHRHDAGLDHALHRIVVRFLRRAAGGVGDHVDLVAALEHRRRARSVLLQTSVHRPETTTFLRPLALQRVAHLLVVPGVHRGALEHRLVGEHVQQLGIGVAGEALASRPW